MATKHRPAYRNAIKVAILVAAAVMGLGLVGVIYLDQSVALLAVVLVAWAVLEERWAERWYPALGVRQPDDLFYGVSSYLAGRAIDFRDAQALPFFTPFLRLGLYLLAIYFVWRAFRRTSRR
jgi:hypothetical protein